MYLLWKIRRFSGVSHVTFFFSGGYISPRLLEAVCVYFRVDMSEAMGLGLGWGEGALGVVPTWELSVFFHLQWSGKTWESKTLQDRKKLMTRWFKVTFSSPSWRSLNPLKGSLNHPKKVTKTCQEEVLFLKINGPKKVMFENPGWKISRWKGAP